MAAYGGCEKDPQCPRLLIQTMNEGYKDWRAMKSMLTNRGLGINANKCLHEGVI